MQTKVTTLSAWRSRMVVVACLSTLVLGGCAQFREPEALHDVQLASAEWLEAQKSVVGARAEARWHALMERDYEKAYQFQSPDYRSVFSLQHFAGQFGNALNLRLATVKSVEYDDNNVAQLRVEVEYDAPLTISTSARGVRTVRESWLYLDGEWWYISR